MTSNHTRGTATALLSLSLAMAAAAADPAAREKIGQPPPTPQALSSIRAVPSAIDFQGFLQDSSGVPIEGTVHLDLAIYESETGGTALWTETHQNTPVSHGVFGVVLGQSSPLPASLFAGASLYLGVRVNGEPEMPRTPVHGVPFARAADTADEAFHATTSDFTEFATAAGRAAFADSSGPDGDWQVEGDNIHSALPGNVGIGTPTPSAKLDVVGEARLRDLSVTEHVSLPANALTADAIRDEAGLGSYYSHMTYVGPGTHVILTQTIATPGPGFILAITGGSVWWNVVVGGGGGGGSCQAEAPLMGLSMDTQAFNWSFTLDVEEETAPLALHKVFPVSAAGTHTVYLMAHADLTGDCNSLLAFDKCNLTLLFVPTAYGSVTPASAAEDLSKSVRHGE